MLARRVVELLSERGPLLLVFEDVHWADDSLLDLVDYLVSHVRDHSVAFLALARPEFLESRSNWGAGMTGHTMLPLDWAYTNARLICRPDSDWLSPQKITEGALQEDDA
jgi:hypothetical protein